MNSTRQLPQARVFNQEKTSCCPICQTTFQYMSNGFVKTFCSMACRKVRRNRDLRSARRSEVQCPTCNTAFTTNGLRKYCSVRCTPPNSGGFRKHKKRAIWFGVAHELVYPFRVYECDGWVCQICHLPINPEALAPNRDSASIDHIIPMSKGGSHTYANLQAAHLGCNARKRDKHTIRPEVEQCA